MVKANKLDGSLAGKSLAGVVWDHFSEFIQEAFIEMGTAQGRGRGGRKKAGRDRRGRFKNPQEQPRHVRGEA